MTKVYNILKLKERRVQLRKSETLEEKILWAFLRRNQIGYKFRRQHSIGGYIVDFYCPEKKLVVEIDGPAHSKKENKEYDKVRENYLNSLSIKVLRFTNLEVNADPEKVAKRIKEGLP